MIRIKILSLLIFGNQFAFAQIKTGSAAADGDTVKVLNHQFVSEIIVQSPVPIGSRKKWAGSYAELTGNQLKSGNAYNLQDQLNKVPGVLMQQGTMSTNRITIRGIGSRTPYQSNRIKAYWGEMPLTDGDGATSLEDIGLNDIGKLQVIKGSSSALYGAGMGGAILLDPFDLNSDTSGIILKSEWGSFGTLSQHLQTNWRDRQNSVYSLVGGAVVSDGYRDNSDYQRYNLTFKGAMELGRHRFRFLYNYRYLNGEIPSSLDSADFKFHPSKAAASWGNINGFEKDKRHMLTLGLVSPVGRQGSNTFTLFGKTSNLDELRPFNRLGEDKNSWGFRNRLKTRFAALDFMVGTETMFENNDLTLFSVQEEHVGEKLSAAHHQRFYYNVFALMDVRLFENLVVQSAINHNRTGYRSAGNFKYKPVWSPRLGLNYAIFRDVHVFVSAGHGFSAPSLEEAQLPDGSFNAQIKPEEGWNYETGIRFGDAKKRLSGDISFYRMKMKNILVTERDPEDRFYGKNAGKTKHTGVELGLLYKLVKPSEYKSLMARLSFFASKNKFEDFVEDGTDLKNKHLPGIPQSNVSMEISGVYRGVAYTVSHQYFGKQYLNDTNTRVYDSYHKTNVKVSYPIPISKATLNVHLGADNLFDTRYASMVLINAKAFGNNLPRYYYPGLPFNVFGGVGLRF